ncbi:histone-fold-containing protein [Amylostereum chailletii]|nr:histone-fold-containing protein [Amylostereum chailletii]
MKTRNKATKFPVARIKKIMQKDEEVGKVAQATPVVICASDFFPLCASKALELFLQMVIDEASSVTVQRGSKKVEAYHLKNAIENTEMLDFLKEIVSNVPDPSAGGSLSLDAPDDAPPPPKQKKPRKSKAAASASAAAEGSEAPKKRKRRKKAKEEDEGGGDQETVEAKAPTRTVTGPEGWDDEDE